MKVFFDTSFFVEYFRGNENARRIYEELKNYEYFTSLNVVEETTYILMKFTASDFVKLEKHYEVIKKLKEDSNVYEKSLKNAKLFYSSILHDGFQILPLPSWDLVLEIMERYRLLPNDALIAATCKHYGIKKIATFDEDFRRVDFLQVVEL
ncbi:type II toxin-antitoxin system VapC family toxin [Archaeoglobus fulgidus]|jgi:predicted nucleic acid-binding protein|uniref:PIN domain-containing protein n=4 Tax=Archaeoglobus fulgidus TaxID=2234 RepID=O29932_ARCFU|nr:type II toxin-antitoxin system VapC family toxin [Archaeoglobus fulgidus]AAB90920.1 conserved hypothetical protein [Archaeoglobus fulgidus DSM 4304]AIG97133.1 putative nucleic acid-binding protein [Archaeoglobus fulgidus DSM 8774]